MARDNGIIFPSVFGRIRKGLDVPVECILLTLVFNLCFGLLYLGPIVAFSAYAASCTILLNISYAIPVAVLCISGRGVLESMQTPDTPFKLGHTLGLICNWVSVVFVAVTSVFFCFPPGLPVTAGSMNYVSAVIGIFLVLLTRYWFVYGHRFEGPVCSLNYPFETVDGSKDAQKFALIMGVTDKSHTSEELAKPQDEQEKLTL